MMRVIPPEALASLMQRGEELIGMHRGTAPSREYSDDEEELLAAVAMYRQVNHVGFVSITDTFWILQRLGYCRPAATPPPPETPSY